MEHKIDLSAVPHKPGQSTDLEAKRARAWGRLTEDEREYVVEHYGDREPENQPQAPFLEVKGAYERVLYILAVTGQRFTPMELSYLMIARWFRNMDVTTIRARVAAMVQCGDARTARDGRVHITTNGAERLDRIDRSWVEQHRPQRPRTARFGPRSSPDRGERGRRPHPAGGR